MWRISTPPPGLARLAKRCGRRYFCAWARGCAGTCSACHTPFVCAVCPCCSLPARHPAAPPQVACRPLSAAAHSHLAHFLLLLRLGLGTARTRSGTARRVGRRGGPPAHSHCPPDTIAGRIAPRAGPAGPAQPAPERHSRRLEVLGVEHPLHLRKLSRLLGLAHSAAAAAGLRRGPASVGQELGR